MEAPVCKHFQTGFCKFRNECRKLHIKEICQNKDCTSQSCNKRYPKPYKYYKSNQACKFGEFCCYEHFKSTEQNDNEKLLEKVTQMENTIKTMSKQLKLLEEKVKCNNCEQLSCEVCEYKASSSTVLKRHVSTKHKKNRNSTPEKEKKSSHDDSLNISTPIEEREDDTSISISLPVEETPTPETLQFKCCL